MLLGLGISGFPFVGTDIGGFAETPSAELYTRWLQLGVFHPFMRTHTTFGTPDQEPWSYGARHEAVNRRAIELRYELLPQLYQVMREASETGVPALRPLFLEFPDDPETYGLQDQLLLGRDLLVAPILREAQTERSVYLPAGDWYDYWTGRRVKGARRLTVPVTLDSIPIYVRAGAFVFTQPVVQHTGEMQGQPLRVSVYPAQHAEAELYEDDGESLDYREGVYARRRFAQQREAGCQVVTVGSTSGSYRPAARDLVVRIRADGEPGRVWLDRTALARSSAPGTAASGWSVSEDGFVELRLRDKSEAFAVTLESVPSVQAPASRASVPCVPAAR